MAEESQKKWECEYCTYKSWEAAKKCVICQAPRPPKFITEPNQSQDIYQVASLTNSNQSSTPSIPTTYVSDANKWACVKCTYINYVKTKKCVVCWTRKPVDLVNITEALQPLTINTSGSSAAERSNRTSSSPGDRSNKTSPCERSNKTSPKSISQSNRTSPSENETTNNRNSPGNDRNQGKNRAMLSTSYIKTYHNKWTCKVCTYENWPKASRCIICTSHRSPGIRDPSQPAGSIQLSPPNSPRGAAAASLPSNKSSKKGDNFNNALQKIHEKFSELDWLWLKACTGIYNGDRLAIDAYITCGGDVARRLTMEEASLIDDGTRFQKGHTLLHIALQSQREDVVALLLTASVTSRTKKRLPPHTCPELTNEILRTISCSLRQRKGQFPCFFFTECVTFSLPGG